MADVTRKDREAALDALYSAPPADYPLYERWLDGSTKAEDVFDDWTMDAVANAIAQAREEGRREAGEVARRKLTDSETADAVFRARMESRMLSNGR